LRTNLKEKKIPFKHFSDKTQIMETKIYNFKETHANIIEYIDIAGM
jgi:hypothetical protein